ncbi:MAG TPA: hypothetical protein VGX78_19095 [Pirellulales bacterium]|jgi:hypothetical protein|nr:hypothetical protein [Pirellulales bacterium]
MPEPNFERLTRFTPDAGEINRDALLFAAGRASARPNRGWIGLAGALAGSHLLVLTLLWPQSVSPAGQAVPIADTQAPPSASVPSPSIALTGSEVWAMQRDLDDLPNDESPAGNLTLIESGPPWRAFGPPPSSILN